MQALVAATPAWTLSFEFDNGARSAQLSHSGSGAYFVEFGSEDSPFASGHKLSRRRTSLADCLATLAEEKIVPDFGSVDAAIPGSKADDRNRVRDAALLALAEFLACPLPAESELAKARKAFRARKKAKTDAATTERKAARQRQLDAEAAHDARVLAEARATLVNSVPTLISALEKRLADASRVDKAVKMLKGDGFQLFHDVGDQQLVGVVRSQSDTERVYACALGADGSFSCCTQNLNVCGGLNGKPCKHLLVLVLGLAQNGELPVERANEWLVATLVREPKLDRESAAQVFLRYRGATSGELEWRPTETTPEDFYAY